MDPQLNLDTMYLMSVKKDYTLRWIETRKSLELSAWILDHGMNLISGLNVFKPYIVVHLHQSMNLVDNLNLL